MLSSVRVLFSLCICSALMHGSLGHAADKPAAKPAAKPAGKPYATASPLDELDWMIGDWVGETKNHLRVQIVGKWDTNKRFILRRIYISNGDNLVQCSFQRLGYNPAQKAIRSWVFDWDGAFSEGVIRKTDDTWVAESKAVARDGAQSSSKNTYSKIDATGFTVASSAPTVAGKKLPNLTIRFAENQEYAAPKIQTPRSPGETAADEAAKKQIMDSAEFKQVRTELDRWFKVQKAYSPKEVKELKARIDTRVAAMTSAELQEKMDEMQEKLSILLGKDAQGARQWLAQYLAVHAAIPEAEWKKKRPDIAKMSPEQLEEELSNWKLRRSQTIANVQAANQGREMQIQANREDLQAQRASAERALDRAYDDSGYNSGYRW